MSTPTPPITLFGATGFTGQRIARALALEGCNFRIAGRSPEKLNRLSEALPNHPAWLLADAAVPASLPPLVQNTRLLINCAGPYTDLGERVISQAALGGVHYLDITNELGYVFRSRGYHDLAQKTGAALVPACGFEVALADCAAHIAGSALVDSQNPETPLDEVNIFYSLKAKGSSRGTRRSAVRSLATSWVTYRDGAWIGQVPGAKVRSFSFTEDRASGKEITKQYGLSFPSCESLTIPAHLPVRRVDAWIAVPPGAHFLAQAFLPWFARLSRSVLRGLFLSIAAAGGKSPSDAEENDSQASAPFTIYVEVRRGADTRSALLTGVDAYRLTAEIITYAARQLTAPGYDRNGMLAPAQAFDPRAFLAYAQAHWGLTFRELFA